MIKETATALRFGLEKGFVSLTEIEQWADSVLQTDYPYEDWLGDLSTASQIGVPKTYSTLGTVSGEPVPENMWAAYKELFSRKLQSGEISAEEAVVFLAAQAKEFPGQIADEVARLNKDAAGSESGIRELLGKR